MKRCSLNDLSDQEKAPIAIGRRSACARPTGGSGSSYEQVAETDFTEVTVKIASVSFFGSGVPTLAALSVRSASLVVPIAST